MVSEAIKLAVTRVDETRREAVRDLLKRLLEDDALEAVFVVARRANGEWTWNYDGNVFATDMVGSIEIAKHGLIADYIKSTS